MSWRRSVFQRSTDVALNFRATCTSLWTQALSLRRKVAEVRILSGVPKGIERIARLKRHCGVPGSMLT
jgi:hypothetical protein